MDRYDYQKYIYVYFHLKSLLRQWTKFKPSFDAKLATTCHYSLYAKYIHCLSVWQFSMRIIDARLELYRVLNDIYDICSTNHLSGAELVHEYKMGVSLLNLANTILSEIVLQQERFQVVINLSRETLEDVYALPREQFECDNLPFKDLPYEFRTRLVDLFPPRDCVSFKLAGKTATEYVKKRGHFSPFLLVGGNSNSYADMKTFGSKKPDYDITSTTFFLKSDNWYIKNGLYLNLNSTEKFDHAVKIVSGTYRSLQLDGPYTWKHAIHFMNLSKEICDVVLHDGMLLEDEDFNDFFEAVVLYCKNQKNATVIVLRCPDLTEAFGPQFKEYVENRTTFTVKFSGGVTIVYQSTTQKIESLSY